MTDSPNSQSQQSPQYQGETGWPTQFHLQHSCYIGVHAHIIQQQRMPTYRSDSVNGTSEVAVGNSGISRFNWPHRLTTYATEHFRTMLLFLNQYLAMSQKLYKTGT